MFRRIRQIKHDFATFDRELLTNREWQMVYWKHIRNHWFRIRMIHWFLRDLILTGEVHWIKDEKHEKD